MNSNINNEIKKIPIFNSQGEIINEFPIPASFLDNFGSSQIIYDCIIAELANKRQISAKVKTKAMVSGGGRKP
jgi:large subunit ribosomal protein L4